MVFELYLHIAWIIIFVLATSRHIENDKELRGWEPITLIICSVFLFLQEFYQLMRFVITNSAIGRFIAWRYP